MPAKRHNNTQVVTMIGLDFGSTTSSAMAAEAAVGFSSASGKMAFGEPNIVYRSEPVFTPFMDDRIDGARLSEYLDQWLDESRLRQEDLFAGAAIVTGLAAKRKNADEIARMVHRRIGDAVMATADDPCLESWLAFMGSSAALSRRFPDKPVVNLDIGGGTTNPALGIGGNIARTGCYYIGARHFQFSPGTYRITRLSSQALWLLEHLGVSKKPGDLLNSQERNSILEAYVEALESMVEEKRYGKKNLVLEKTNQVPFSTDGYSSPVVTFSGGVGELIYAHSQGASMPGTTFYGDLGIDLAKRIVRSPKLSQHIETHIPSNMGRATVYGLTLHSTEVSGTTLFLSHPERLPRRDVPIVSRLALTDGDAKVESAVAMMQNSRKGAGVQLDPTPSKTDTAGISLPPVESLENIRAFGKRFSRACERLGVSAEQPLILLVPHNYGQVLGNYITNWRQLPLDLIVIDEIPERQAHFVNIGRPSNNMAPVSFYGIYESTGQAP